MSYIENMEPEDTGLEPNAKYTVFLMDDMLGFTHRLEVQIVEIRKVEAYAQYSNLLQAAVKQRGKRKLRGFYLEADQLFLQGWDLEGIKIDTDFNGCSSNACLNFIGNPGEIRRRIDTLNKYKLADKGLITYALDETTNPKKMLYKDLARKIAPNHAVVRSILEIDNEVMV